MHTDGVRVLASRLVHLLLPFVIEVTSSNLQHADFFVFKFYFIFAFYLFLTSPIYEIDILFYILKQSIVSS